MIPAKSSHRFPPGFRPRAWWGWDPSCRRVAPRPGHQERHGWWVSQPSRKEGSSDNEDIGSVKQQKTAQGLKKNEQLNDVHLKFYEILGESLPAPCYAMYQFHVIHCSHHSASQRSATNDAHNFNPLMWQDLGILNFGSNMYMWEILICNTNFV